jgi:hypothetical protein
MDSVNKEVTKMGPNLGVFVMNRLDERYLHKFTQCYLWVVRITTIYYLFHRVPRVLCIVILPKVNPGLGYGLWLLFGGVFCGF